MTRIVLRPLASPLPLAFSAFGAGSLMLSGLQLGMIPASETRSVALVQAAFVFPPLALSSVLAFLSRETLGATIMALISFSWLANGLIDLTTPPTSTNATQGPPRPRPGRDPAPRGGAPSWASRSWAW